MIKRQSVGKAKPEVVIFHAVTVQTPHGKAKFMHVP